MEHLNNNEKVCPYCGYKLNSAYDKSYLAPNTILNNERYTVGKLLSCNGESALYIAYDNIMGCKVQVREYMPNTLCTRSKNSPEIIVNDGCKVQYKSLMAEFTELNRSLVKLRNVGNITPVLDLFNDNNTSYAVYEYTDGVKLIDYLKDNMGELSWEETAKLFPPLITTIGLLHQAGIVHRAISPDTIYYTSRNELRLTDFCISAVRTKGTELNDELYKGYSAPEQYTINGKQGTWTDVYGISAVLYKVLTGCMPTEATTRLDHDNLCPLTDINMEISENISKAIMQGMNVSIDSRISTVNDLVTALFAKSEKKEHFSSTIRIPRTLVTNGSTSSGDTSLPTPSTETSYEVAEEPQATLFDKIKFPLMIGVLLLAIMLVLGIVLVNMFSSSDNDSDSLLQHTNSYNSTDTSDNVVEVTTTQPTITYMMQNFVGKDVNDVTKDEDLKDKLNFEIEYVYSNDYEIDRIVEQSIPMGDKYTEGDTVTLKVSQGPKTVEIPDYKTGSMSCYSKDDYIKILESKGIPYELVAVVNWGYYSGYVIGTEPSAGEILDVEAGEVLTVTYTDNPSTNAETTRYVVSTTTATQAVANDVDDDSDTSQTSYIEQSSYSAKTTTATESKSYNNSNYSINNSQYQTQATVQQTQAPTYTEAQKVEQTQAPVVQQTEAQVDYNNNSNDGNSGYQQQESPSNDGAENNADNPVG